ncbi:MAG TPA: cysteine hydrolase [Gammaproteobacteria bacterium]|nr:cysteine hydrolase [Gammaproteobacteria bacterium]
MELTSAGTVLVIIDMQNGFLHDEGSCAGIGLPVTALQAALPGCRQLLGAARRDGMPVIFTRYVYRPDYSDGGVVIREFFPDLATSGAFRSGSWDADVVDELAPREGELVVDKNRPSAFYGTPLESYLRGLGADSLIVCGVTTNVCVETTVRDAMQRDLKVWVVGGATAEFDRDRHESALQSMGWMFGQVVQLDAALEQIPHLGRNRQRGAGDT